VTLLPQLALVALGLVAAGAPAAFAQAQAPAAASAPAPAASSGLPADLPLRRDADLPGPAGNFGPWLVVLGVALGGLWLVRRARAPGRAGWPFAARSQAAELPTVLASRSLGPHGSLQVVAWNGKELLLGCSAQAITVLDSRPVGSQPAGDAAAAEGSPP